VTLAFLILATAACAFLIPDPGALATAKPLPPRRDRYKTVTYPDVHVLVARVRHPGRISYHYTVVNRSSSPITRILIGFHYEVGDPELNYGPLGLDSTGVPPGSYGSPSGWDFRLGETEDDPHVDIEWSAIGHSADIPPGSSRSGFEVSLSDSADDPCYGTAHWTAYLSTGLGPLSGLLESKRHPQGH
jgi:hypothetical protein